jgi:hypothetical protein
MDTGKVYLSLQSISYQLMSENSVRVTNIANACFVFGDIFIEFPLKTKLTHQHGHSCHRNFCCMQLKLT